MPGGRFTQRAAGCGDETSVRLFYVIKGLKQNHLPASTDAAITPADAVLSGERLTPHIWIGKSVLNVSIY